ncbi:P110/LppT family adhesin N-terminal domain [Mycoplasma sp. 'Moose RK']|uniref:P110/LppT family adhesin N-terminal domain n=1 Tax=Mycoplasma sp. 'Moose RK' TaxID=2780095 RepID=UPI0018C20778|nr:P110/LppT family adhesin N-terminal domain [Mycoplasma sp. 'Moose RK']MBG0730925.1 P110/LppT family adhesin N-terminal domain [Mycoplasma sp. 'Moose RK']
MKLVKKQILIIASVLGSALVFSGVVGTAIGINAYKKSYYSILNQKPAELKVAVKSTVSPEEFAGIVANLKVKADAPRVSAKTALALTKNQLYQFDLTTFFDFEPLKSKGFAVSLDFSQAEVDKNSIKKVVVFAKSEKEKNIFSLVTELKGFAENDGFDGDLNKFYLDPSKSFASISNGFFTPLEFQQKLQENYQNSWQINSFVRLENALINSGATLSLYNSLGSPIFISDNFQLEPVLVKEKTQEKLSFSEQDGKLFLDLELKDKITQKSVKYKLEIRGLVSKEQLSQELESWFATNLEDKIQIKPEVQKAIVDDNTSFIDFFYGSSAKNGNQTQKLANKKAFSDIFLIHQSDFDVRTKNFGTYSVKIIRPEVVQKNEISPTELAKLEKAKKIRFVFHVDVKRPQAKITSKLAVPVDLEVDLSKYERVLGRIFGSVNSVQTFSIPENSTRILSTKEIKTTIDELFELAKIPSNLENPSDDVVVKVYLLDHGRYPSDSEKKIAKDALKKAIIAAKTKGEKAENAAPKSKNDLQSKTSKNGAKSQETKNENDAEKKEPKSLDSMKPAKAKVSAFADIETENQSANLAQNSESGIGTNIWKAINAALIYNLNDVSAEYQIKTIDANLVFEFKFVAKSDKNRVLASSQLIINNVINSQKSAYDVIKKFNPSLFLEPISARFKADVSKKTAELADPANQNLLFKSESATLTQNGLELTQPLKFQVKNDLKLRTVEPPNRDDYGDFKYTPKPQSRLDSGALYLAFNAKNISDGKQHYLLADSNNKGIFIQKMQTSDKKSFFIIGMDYKFISKYSLYGWGTNKGMPEVQGNLFLLPFSNKINQKLLDEQQILVTSGLQKISQEDAKSWLASAGKETETQKKPRIGDVVHNVWFAQKDFGFPESEKENQKGLIQEDANILIEILKTPYSLKLSLFSSENSDLNVKEVGTLLYNVDLKGNWNPFPNFFNLDWNQIGPNSTKPEVKVPVESKKVLAAEDLKEKSSAKTKEVQPSTETEKKATMTLKALAVFDDPLFTTREYAKNRNEILRAFLDSYIKK